MKNKELLKNAKGCMVTLKKNEYGHLSINVEIEDYQHVGYTLKSILSVCQSALEAEEEEVHCHTYLDIFNMLELAKNLVPEPELEFLDLLLKKIKNKH